MHLHNLSLTKARVTNVTFLLCSAHFTSSLQDIVSHWTFSASASKAVIFRVPKLLKDLVPGSHTTVNNSPFQEQSHFCTDDSWLHRRWGLAVGQAPDQKDTKTDKQQQLPLPDAFLFWHYTLHLTCGEKGEKININTLVFLGKDRHRGVTGRSDDKLLYLFLSQKVISNHRIEWDTETREKHRPKHNHRQ